MKGMLSRRSSHASPSTIHLHAIHSISAFVYIQPALIAPPTLPRVFGGNRHDRLEAADDESHDETLDAECSVSKFLYDIMCYNLRTQSVLAKDDDMAARLAYYRELLDWEMPRRGPRSSRGLHGLCQSLFIE